MGAASAVVDEERQSDWMEDASEASVVVVCRESESKSLEVPDETQPRRTCAKSSSAYSSSSSSRLLFEPCSSSASMFSLATAQTRPRYWGSIQLREPS